MRAFLRDQTRFSDAQCRFKAITKRAAAELLLRVEDNGWFFDTELWVWAEDADSQVRLVRTAWQNLCGLRRLRRNLARSKVS